MAIKGIGEVPRSTNVHDNKTEYDRWATLEQIRTLDRKQNTKTGFRNAVGMNQSEYKKQTEEAKKRGFDAILREEMEKHAS